MTFTLLLAGWILLSLLTTAGMALVCHGGAQQDRARAHDAREHLALPQPRPAADGQIWVASSGSVTTSDTASSADPSPRKSLAL